MLSAIIPCAGQGKRMGRTQNKIFLELQGQPIIVRTIQQLLNSGAIDELIVVAASDEVTDMSNLLDSLALQLPWRVVVGGAERQYSIQNALAHLSPKTEWVLIHDGARPLVDPVVVRQVVQDAKQHGAAILGVPVKDTIKEVQDQLIVATPERSRLWAVHTPQVFRTDWLKAAYSQAEQQGFLGTDDASLVERLGKPIFMTCDSYENLKITTPEDLEFVEKKLQGGEKMHIGFGYDVHELIPNRSLVLGGVVIPYEFGLKGHSDADVLLHAIADALLGAAALGDIGRHFPDHDPAYKGISSLLLLEKVGQMLKEQHWQIQNIDATIVAQKPKLAAYIPEMNCQIAQVLHLADKQVNVKATTTEGLGFAGRKEGIASYAVALIH